MLPFSIRRPPARLGMVASAIAADEECATALSHNTPVQQDWTAAECTSVDGARLTSRLFQEASLMPLAVLSLTRHVRDECPPKCATEVILYAIDRVQYDATYDSSSLENELNDSFLMNLDGCSLPRAPRHHDGWHRPAKFRLRVPLAPVEIAKASPSCRKSRTSAVENVTQHRSELARFARLR
ncbi:hypothetical protein ACVWZ6_002394 [Bradyrhizobium sp. GM6.1]